MWNIFHIFVGHLDVIFGKTSIGFFCPFFNKMGFFVVELYIWLITPYSTYIVGKNIVSFCRLHLLFIFFFCYMEAFNFDVLPLIDFCFSLTFLGIEVITPHSNTLYTKKSLPSFGENSISSAS